MKIAESKKLTEKYTELIFAIGVILIVETSLIIPLYLKGESFAPIVIIGAFIIAAITASLYNLKKIELRKLNTIEIILTEIIAISFLFHGLFFRVLSYIAIAGLLGVIFPFSYMVLSSLDQKKVMRGISIGLVISFIIFYVTSFIFGPPINYYQYTSYLTNPNTLGYFISLVLPAAVYLILHDEHPGLVRKYGMLFVLGSVLSVGFFSNSRTSMIAVLIELILAIIYILIKTEKGSRKKLIGKALSVIIATVISFLVFFYLFGNVKFNIANKGKQTGSEITISDSIKISELRYGKGISSENTGDISSGRIGIWKDFIKNTGIIGHASEMRRIESDGRLYRSTNAHNAFLQIGYSAGAIAGIAMFLLEFLIGVKYLLILINGIKKNNLSGETLFCGQLMVSFFIVSLTSAGYMPFTYLPATFFWMLMYRVLGKEVRSN